MSTTVETNVSWRKRKRPDEPSELQISMKRPRYYYYRLASESSKASEEDTESIHSVQDLETDVVRDTSDTDSGSDDRENFEFEYEVASLSGSENEILGYSTSDSDDQMIVAAAIGAMCDSSLETWITDGEDSDSSMDNSSLSITMLGFTTCVQCKSVNDNPLYRYCEKCFQDRKKCYPPRPRGNKKSRKKTEDPPVKLDTLRSCLSVIASMDSGIGSSQECPSLGLDKIIIPDKHLSKTGTSITDVRDILPDNSSKEHDREIRRKRKASESSLSDFDIKKPKLTRSKSRDIILSRPSSRNTTNDKKYQPLTENNSIILKDQIDKKMSMDKSSSVKCISLSQTSTETTLSQTSTETALSQTSTETALSQTSTETALSQTSEDTISLSQMSTLTSSKEYSQSSGFNSEISTNSFTKAKSAEKSLSLDQNSDNVSDVGTSTSLCGSSGSQMSELCIICNVEPQNSIFLHTNIGHQCCCYKCAKRTLHTLKRCPICNRSVNKVVKIFKA